MPFKSKEDYNRYMREYRRKKNIKTYMREYRARKKAKIAELKRLASQPITFMSGVELAEKIKEL